MAAKGSSLSNYNQELVRCIEDLREKREEVNRSILRDEEEKAKLQRELTRMTERLAKLNEDLARKMQVRHAYWRALPQLCLIMALMSLWRCGLNKIPVFFFFSHATPTFFFHFWCPCSHLSTPGAGGV